MPWYDLAVCPFFYFGVGLLRFVCSFLSFFLSTYCSFYLSFSPSVSAPFRFSQVRLSFDHNSIPGGLGEVRKSSNQAVKHQAIRIDNIFIFRVRAWSTGRAWPQDGDPDERDASVVVEMMIGMALGLRVGSSDFTPVHINLHTDLTR